jgi:hypothetical protein
VDSGHCTPDIAHIFIDIRDVLPKAMKFLKIQWPFFKNHDFAKGHKLLPDNMKFRQKS